MRRLARGRPYDARMVAATTMTKTFPRIVVVEDEDDVRRLL